MGRKKKESNETESKASVKKIGAKERVKKELDDLIGRNEKLGNLLGKVKASDVKLLESLNGEQKKLLAKQYMMQNKLIHILKRRLEIWTE